MTTAARTWFSLSLRSLVAPPARRTAPAMVAVLAGTMATTPVLAQIPADQLARVDAVFERWNSLDNPGCAVAASRDGRPLFSRAYGSANLEFGIPNHPGTIFEAGSVSKQFTAAAIVLLALEGKLSLDDDVRSYVPELPDYGSPITIRHLMTHTSGLRDWGSVAGISGWGRSSRTHSHAHVLDILSRQTALNFTPGEEYSYSNSGYNLMAVIVDRVSGMPFAEFSRQRIFEPLGMHDTQWRDDYRRLVAGRATAYSPRGNGFVIDQPIEHVHGNGGLLTTVRDLLTWNRHMEDGTLGEEFVAIMHQRGELNAGNRITYAGGLMIGQRNGHPSVTHTGATSGYRAYLGRFPEQGLSVALLCNVTNANPGELGGRVADLFLPEAPRPVAQPGQQLAAVADGRGEDSPVYSPTEQDLASFMGEYHSHDAEATFHVTVDDGRLVLHRRPDARFPLEPVEADTFRGQPGRVRFIRDGAGNVTGLSLGLARVYDMRFQRITR